MTTPQDMYITGLRNAHAMENQALAAAGADARR